MKDIVNILGLSQNMPPIETLSNMSRFISQVAEGIDSISSMASIISNSSLPVSEIGSITNNTVDTAPTLPEWIGEIGSSFEFAQAITRPMDGLVAVATMPYPEGVTKFLESFSEASSQLSSMQETFPTPSDFRSSFRSSTSFLPEIPEDELPLLLKTRKSHLECIINNCYFEPGISTEANEYFSELWEAMGKNSLDILSELVNEHLDDEHVLEGVLHILSFLPYEEITPVGITIGIACGFNHSPLVVDRLIACFEDWEDPAAIRILDSMDLSSIPWLSNYRDRVVSMLEQKI